MKRIHSFTASSFLEVQFLRLAFPLADIKPDGSHWAGLQHCRFKRAPK